MPDIRMLPPGSRLAAQARAQHERTQLGLRILRAVLIAVTLVAAPLAAAQPAARVVYVAEIEGMIDLGLAPYVQRVLEEAAAAKAAAVVLRINTFGGRVDAAVQIRDALLSSPMRTIAFVDRRAISAGALISLAAENIVMAGGSTIGAATPVQAGDPGSTPQPVQEKTVSYVRKEFRATAESRKRPALIAEAMVDADVEIPKLIEKGKLLTLTTDEALTHKVADARADSLEAALDVLGLGGAQLRTTSPNWAERVVRLLTHPVVSSLLMTVAMLGIIIELRTPGFGIPGALGLGSLGLFLWGHWLVQLVGWEEVLLALGGIVLLLLEFFVIPGFGIAGVLGIVALVTGLVLSLLGSGDNAPQFIVAAASRVVFALLLALGASLLLMRFLPRLPFGKALILNTGLGAGSGYTSEPPDDAGWLGREGIALSPLRPAGVVDIEGERVDVVSDGEFVAAGERVRVTRVDGNRIVVRRSPTTQERTQA
jgi:membrane-bound serine protease (ClpP class)